MNSLRKDIRDKITAELPILLFDKLVLGLIAACVIIPIQLLQDNLTLKQEQKIQASMVAAKVVESSIKQLESSIITFQVQAEKSKKLNESEWSDEEKKMDIAKIKIAISLNTISVFDENANNALIEETMSAINTTFNLIVLAKKSGDWTKFDKNQICLTDKYKNVVMEAQKALLVVLSKL